MKISSFKDKAKRTVFKDHHVDLDEVDGKPTLTVSRIDVDPDGFNDSFQLTLKFDGRIYSIKVDRDKAEFICNSLMNLLDRKPGYDSEAIFF